MRDQRDMSGHPKNAIYGRGDRLPAGLFGTELFLAGGGQFVEAGATTGLFGDPSGANPSGFFHAVEGGIERTFFNTEHFPGHVLDGGHDGVAMEARAPREYLQDQQI
jgi:hypothetical protein